ncbi:uncharacterized protein LOC143025678 [Oratosquilla oratoria]|uniref:uncharacterized protein LOC143025678 n=1 Tax=Oratosquilla oratoria TaxID=337810 RepID=UPI003F7601AF
MASLDVTNLFTSIPTVRTVKMILNYVYNHPDLTPPSIPRNILEEMLICTTEAPFRCPEGNLYVQHDGVTMGSPLGVLVAQASMSAVEHDTFQDKEVNSQLYCKYIDDIFICTHSLDLIETLRSSLQENSGLAFTIEMNSNGKHSFLDVLVRSNSGEFVTGVDRKPTNADKCMNDQGECSEK